jgi:L-ascorbate metabolism protein UlaG (beta-lactamase superfamily)
MKKLNVEVEHIVHSCFTVETEKHFLVFDYYKGDIQLSGTKKNYIFVTHGHGDHFTPEIFNWKEDNIKYILSSDINDYPENKDVYIMNPGEILELDDLNIKSFGSTDLGLSFLVNIDYISIFHAGDLNWWYWDNDTDEEKNEMEAAFKGEIAKIKGEEIDIAFFPVDPRLEENFYLGGKYFINEIQPKNFFPMHFGDKFQTSNYFIHKMSGTRTNIVELSHENQIIEL